MADSNEKNADTLSAYRDGAPGFLNGGVPQTWTTSDQILQREQAKLDDARAQRQQVEVNNATEKE